MDFWTAVGLDRIEAYKRMLTEHARSWIEAIAGVQVLGDARERVSVLSFVVDGKKPSDVSKALDADGIAVSAGKLAAEPLLKKLGVQEATRVSFTFYNTVEEVDALASSLARIAAR